MEENKNKRGGIRKGSGRKPLDVKKEPITVYIEPPVIDEHGGREAIKKIMTSAVYDNRTNPFINAARGRDESGVNEYELRGKLNKPNKGKSDTPATNDTKNENKEVVGAENASQVGLNEPIQKKGESSLDFRVRKIEYFESLNKKK